MPKPSTRERRRLILMGLVVYAAIIGLLVRDRYVALSDTTRLNRSTTETKTKTVVIDNPKKEVRAAQLPDKVNIAVPFTVQAPFANWDAVHEETCEEASLLMVRYFRLQQKLGSPEAVDSELIALINWETRHSYPYDVTVSQLSKIAADYYSMTSARLIKNPTITDLKTELAAGRPIIVPAAGQLLDNPYFSGGGPPYHMLVVRGYDRDGFIVNDPGTRHGENYHYTFDNLFESIHDWTGSKTTITHGQKAVLVFD